MASTPREQIVSAARGDQPMDLVVRNVELVNVFTTEIYRADLGIKGDRYAAVVPYQDGRRSWACSRGWGCARARTAPRWPTIVTIW